jgi:hypothetical protein
MQLVAHVGRPSANSGPPAAPLLACRCANVMEYVAFGIVMSH